MRYLIAILLPPLGMLSVGKVLEAIVCLFLMFTIVGGGSILLTPVWHLFKHGSFYVQVPGGDRKIAWTPTLTAVGRALPDDAPQEQRERREQRLENYRAQLAPAAARGVTILAGTDAARTLVEEVQRLVALGLTPVQALRAATTSARAFLKVASIEPDEPADVVTFDDDPRDDPEVLSHPAAVVPGGVRIA